MERYIFECETLTPMFISGANTETPEFRPPSIKGLLRFWWRALQACNKGFHTAEKEIFGGSGDGGKKSSFTIKIIGANLENYKSKAPLARYEYTVKGHKLNILDYLAYGTYKGNVFSRYYIKPGYKFTIEIDYFNKDKNSHINEVLEAFKVFCMFGTIGSKSRNGYGSFRVISSVEGFDFLPRQEAVWSYMEKFNAIPQYSAFSTGVKLYRTREQYNNWHSCLAKLGFIYRDARLALEPKHNYNMRKYLASPLIIDKSDNQSILDRHAKPYFMKVHKQDGVYTGYILYLPSLYCAGLSKDRFENKINQTVEDANFLQTCNKLNANIVTGMDVIV